MVGSAEDETRLDRFYADLPVIDRFADVSDATRYRQVPEAWSVIVTDVEGSTSAIEQGRYKDVNALGVASIVAVRNALPGLEVPFVFGGDGATLLVPSHRLEPVRTALRGVRRTAREQFDLAMRIGIVPVSSLSAQGHRVLLARLKVSSKVQLAMLAGDGVTVAEQWVKGTRGVEFAISEQGDDRADYAGFECRWQPVPSRRGVMLTMIVRAAGTDRETDAATYRSVIDRIEAILDDVRGGCPIAPEQLVLANRWRELSQERRVRSSGSRMNRLGAALRVGMGWMVGRVLMAGGWRAAGFDGAAYRDEITRNCDFRKFDDTLRMVVDVEERAAEDIEKILRGEEQAGRLLYGAHYSNRALVTCYVGDYASNHVHFVDGADGGYAMAAKALKGKAG